MADRYVSPEGSVVNDGTLTHPWLWLEVLDGTKVVAPGDRVLFLAGTYVDAKETTPGYPWDKRYYVEFNGTVGSPIHMIPVPGEHVVIDGKFCLNGAGDYVYVHDFELFNSTARLDPAGISAGSFPSELTDWGYCGVEMDNCVGAKAYNNMAHGGRSGFDLWDGALLCEMYGNIVYDYGWRSEVEGATGAHGHGVYTQNDGVYGTKTFRHNVFGRGFYGLTHRGHYAIHVYAESLSTKLENFLFDENAAFGQCSCYHDNIACDDFIFTDCVFSSSKVGSNSSIDDGGISLGKQVIVDGTAVFTGNVLVNTACRVANGTWSALTMSANAIFKTVAGWFIASPGEPPGMDETEVATFEDVSSAGGEDQVFVWPNQYDVDRATIIILDLDKDGSVDVGTEVGTFLSTGENFRVVHYKDFYGTAIAEGAWSGSLVLDVLEEITFDGVLESSPHDAFIVFKLADNPTDTPGLTDVNNMTSVDPSCSAKGPIMQNFAWDEENKMYWELLSYEVPHGIDLPEGFYGLLKSEIKASNTNKSRTVLTLAARNETGVYIFPNRCEHSDGIEATLKRFATNWTKCVRIVEETGSLSTALLALTEVQRELIPVNDEHTRQQITSVQAWNILTSKRYGREGQGNLVTETQEVVAAGSTADIPTLTVVSSEIEALDKNKSIKSKISVSGWPTLESKEREPESRLQITTEREVVSSSTSLSVATAGVEVTLEAIDAWRSLKVTRTLEGWSGHTYEYWEMMAYTFPAFLMPVGAGVNQHADGHFSTADAFLPHQKRSVFKLNVNRRSAYTKRVRARVDVTFSATLPAISTSLVSIRPHDIVYDGLLFSINERNILSDSGSLTANTSSGDTFYGFGVESFSYDESWPLNASEYIALVAGGLFQPVAEELVRWRFNLYKKLTFNLILQ